MARKPWRTCIAQAVYWLGVVLARLKTPQRTYTITCDDPLTFKFSGWWRGPCPVAFRLLEVSERIDPAHWEHWALLHPGSCSGGRCSVCGGVLCTACGETEHCAGRIVEAVNRHDTLMAEIERLRRREAALIKTLGETAIALDREIRRTGTGQPSRLRSDRDDPG